MELVTHLWEVTHRDKHDDLDSLSLAIKDPATSPHEAWRHFLKLVGGDRPKWNKRDYVARRIRVVASFESSDGE